MRTIFFRPRKKVDEQVQTVTGKRHKQDEDKTVEDELRELSTESIILQSWYSKNSIEKAQIMGTRSNVLFCISCFNDKRFDSLTPPNKQLDDITPCLTLQMFPDCFSLSTNKKEIGKFPYKSTTFPILRSFEIGQISPHLYFILTEAKFDDYEDGQIVASIIDHRIDSETEIRTTLKVSEELKQVFLGTKSMTIHQRNEVEKKVALVRHPTLCLDPSTDVARAEAVLDGREKAFINYNERTEKDFRIARKTAIRPRNVVDFQQATKASNVFIPPRISQLFSSIK